VKKKLRWQPITPQRSFGEGGRPRGGGGGSPDRTCESGGALQEALPRGPTVSFLKKAAPKGGKNAKKARPGKTEGSKKGTPQVGRKFIKEKALLVEKDPGRKRPRKKKPPAVGGSTKGPSHAGKGEK